MANTLGLGISVQVVSLIKEIPSPLPSQSLHRSSELCVAPLDSPKYIHSSQVCSTRWGLCA